MEVKVDIVYTNMFSA